MINEKNSVFSSKDVRANDPSFSVPRSGVRGFIWRLLPTLSKNVTASANYGLFASQLEHVENAPRVLVIGAGTEGEGMSKISDGRITFIETDIALGSTTRLVCDGHDIPFADESFEGCVVQAVLQHVVDPYRCVSEIHRILKPGGVVYAETAFMQQVHGGEYDFTRFTHRGQRPRWTPENRPSVDT